MIAYLDCPSGLSGDMLLGCLIDCGWEEARLHCTIESLALPASQWAVEIGEVQKGVLRARKVDVLVEQGRERRGLKEVTSIIKQSSLSDAVKSRAAAIFTRLAEAEAKVHGITPERVHFHEVGALDAIIDIVGAVTGLHDLGIERLYASALPLGHGWTEMAHGRLPLPAPATVELLAAVGAPTRPAPGPGELLTPTAAAILAELARFEQPVMTLRRIGVGAGDREFAWPNVARMWLGDAAAESESSLVQIETNIDDMNPQFYPAVMEKLLAQGALDVWLTPVQMKKGRPGVVLSALCRPPDESWLVELILRQTTSLGVRVHAISHRHEARRQSRRVQTRFGTVRVKLKWVGGEAAGVMPEYEDCLLIAQQSGIAVRDVHEAAIDAARELLWEPEEQLPVVPDRERQKV